MAAANSIGSASSMRNLACPSLTKWNTAAWRRPTLNPQPPNPKPSVPMMMRQSTGRSLGSRVHRRMSRGHAESSRGKSAAEMGAGTYGGGWPTFVAAPIAANPEISDRPRRRTFSAPEKLRILKEADQRRHRRNRCDPRRHGLYRPLWASGAVSGRREPWAGWTPARRAGRNRARPIRWPQNWPLHKRKMAQLRRRLERAEVIIDVQKLPIYWESSWRRSRQRSCATTRPDRRVDIGDAGLARTVSATCAALGPVARQPATQHQTPIPSADRSAVTAQPSQSVAGRVAANCA